jgi:23S rRNA (guanosine2251-2'-O)-methyltransferase
MQHIYGVNPVLEMLKCGNGLIHKIIISRGRSGGPLEKILQLAADRGIPVEISERKSLDSLCRTKAHQGVLCLCEEYSYDSLDHVIKNRHPAFQDNLVLILDSITDPQNLGSLIRTACCSGANGVVIQQDRAARVTSAVMKASAGAARHVPVARVVNLSGALDTLKSEGFWIYGAEAHSGNDFQTLNYSGHVGLVMGSEGKGLRPLIRQKCDFLVSIPLYGQIDSLNVSAAAAVMLYEVLHSRRRVKTE